MWSPSSCGGGRERFFFQIIRGLLTQREVSFPVAKWRIVQKSLKVYLWTQTEFIFPGYKDTQKPLT